MIIVRGVAVFALVLVGGGCGRVDFTPSVDAAMTYRDVVLVDQPVAYWPLADTTGNVAVDVAGADPGTYSGGCTFGVSGPIVDDPATAVRFDGVSCEVKLSEQLNFAGTAPFSIEMWVSTAIDAGTHHYFTRETRNGNLVMDGYALLQNASGVYTERSVSGANTRTPPVLLPSGAFIYAVSVYDGGTLVLYLDAELASSSPDTAALNTFSVGALIGAQPTGAYFAGVMAEVAIYDHVLTADRVALHYQIGTQGPR